MCCSGSQFTEIYDDFIKIIKWLIHAFVCNKSVKMSPKDPPFVTTRIKFLLHRRNKLRLKVN